jgi:hypothetical protein
VPRLRNATTRAVVNVSEEKAARLGSGWIRLDAPAERPAEQSEPEQSAEQSADDTPAEQPEAEPEQDAPAESPAAKTPTPRKHK